MRAPMSLPLADPLLVLAQSGRSLVITKPAAGQPGILQIAPARRWTSRASPMRAWRW